MYDFGCFFATPIGYAGKILLRHSVMQKNLKIAKLIYSKPDLLREARRYLANGKETIGKSPIDGKLYADEKYVREGAGIAYLAALKAIDGYLVGRG